MQITSKNRDKVRVKALTLFKKALLTPSIYYHLCADIEAGHSRKSRKLSSNSTPPTPLSTS